MKLVLQLAIGGWHEQLLELTKERHRALSNKYGYTYQVVTSRTCTRHLYWEKPLAIQRAINDGYSSVAYLDADTVWIDGPLIVPETPLGAVLHKDPMDHYNLGVLYVNCQHDRTTELFDLWLNTSDDNHLWHEQYSLYKILQEDPSYMTQIGYEWNSLVYNELSHPNPFVIAWHGRNDLALEEMSNYLDRNR